jgi:Glycosyltransferase family 92
MKMILFKQDLKTIAFLLLLSLTGAIFGNKYDLSICAIFHNEESILKEWIEFHKIQGVKHFYLYDHFSSDGSLDILKPYVDNGEVTLRSWHKPFRHSSEEGTDPVWETIQIAAYNDCINTYRYDSKWIAFLDLDEFCYCKNLKPLTAFLKNFEGYGGVVVNWHLFGSSKLAEIPIGKTLIESLTSCAVLSENRNCIIKSIVQPKYAEKCINPHFFKYKEGFYAVDEDKRITSGWRVQSPKHEKIKINHYWTRNHNYFVAEKIKRRQSWHDTSIESLWKRYHQYNEDQNFDILPFVDKLRHRLGLDD